MIILSIGFQKVVGSYSAKLGKLRQDADGLVIQKSQESLGGIKDVKVLGKTRYFADRFCHFNLISSDVCGKQYLLGQLPRMYLETIGVLVLSVLVFLFNQLVTANQIYIFSLIPILASILHLNISKIKSKYICLTSILGTKSKFTV